jgi:hypothetical protein
MGYTEVMSIWDIEIAYKKNFLDSSLRLEPALIGHEEPHINKPHGPALDKASRHDKLEVEPSSINQQYFRLHLVRKH